jgi:hypothetical protein
MQSVSLPANKSIQTESQPHSDSLREWGMQTLQRRSRRHVSRAPDFARPGSISASNAPPELVFTRRLMRDSRPSNRPRCCGGSALGAVLDGGMVADPHIGRRHFLSKLIAVDSAGRLHNRRPLHASRTSSDTASARLTCTRPAVGDVLGSPRRALTQFFVGELNGPNQRKRTTWATQ